MVKSEESLSSDIALIKEFEELKLKQKLLIESLRKKGGGEDNQLLMDLNSKLDFIVKIFQEVNENSESTEVMDELKKEFKSVDEKLNSFKDHFEEKFSELDDKISELKEFIENRDVKSDATKLAGVSEGRDNSSTSDGNTSGQSVSGSSNVNSSPAPTSQNSAPAQIPQQQEAPKPNFVVDDKIESVMGGESQKKRRWF